MVKMSVEQHLLLVAAVREPGQPGWLGLDLVGGDRVLSMATLDRAPREAPGAILIRGGGGDECRQLPDGGLLIGEGVLWSLLDPLDAAIGLTDESGDRIQVETSLRGAFRRFIQGIRRWREQDELLREKCRNLLHGYEPDLTPLLEIIDQAAVPGLERAVATAHDGDPAGAALASIAPQDIDLPTADPDHVYRWLQEPAGLGAFYGADFSPRVEQAEMGRDVSQALAAAQPLLVEAGTGVGKTLAYLVPLIATVNEHGGRAVVSTHTRALQTQILDKDLPRLGALLGDRRYALLMGRRNYLCLRQRQSFLTQPVTDFGDALRAVAFRLWLEATTDGMREELAEHPVLRSEVGALFDAADLCLPGQCYEGNRCCVQNARRRAREADLLVVNHSLLMHDLRAEHTLIGEMDHLVIDEAHRLPAVALETHGVLCSPRRLDELEDLLGKRRGTGGAPERTNLVARRLAALGPEGEKAAASCDDFGRSVGRVRSRFRKWWQGLGGQVDVALPGAGHRQGRLRVRDKDEAFGALRPVTTALLEELAEAGSTFALLAGRVGILEDLTDGLEDELALLAQAGQLLRQLEHDIRFLTSDPDEDWVTWLDPAPTHGLRRLGATLLEAGPLLRDYWLGSGLHPVMTSATLAVNDDFSHMLGELGLTRRHPATATATSRSPFDFHRQARILVPARFPAPDAPDFGRAVGEVIRDLTQGVARKTLGLFTSYRLLRDARDVLLQGGIADDPARVESGEPLLLAQSPGAAAGAMMDRFRRHSRAVLLGTNTFWEGVDFPGEDLEILVVTKLPFLVPNDPWVEARCERVAAAGDNPFTSFMVRDAVLRLRQGFGRLIRRVEDRGIVIILDNRLHTKKYGVTFLGALPVVPAAFGDSADLLARIDGFFRQRED